MWRTLIEAVKDGGRGENENVSKIIKKDNFCQKELRKTSGRVSIGHNYVPKLFISSIANFCVTVSNILSKKV